MEHGILLVSRTSSDVELLTNLCNTKDPPSILYVCETLEKADVIITSRRINIAIIDIDAFQPLPFWLKMHQGFRILLITKKWDTRNLYFALRLKAEDLLLRPLKQEKLEKAMNDAAQQDAKDYNAIDAIRHVFMYEELGKLTQNHRSLEELNYAFGLSFAQGLFRGILFKIDCDTNVMVVFENNEIRNKLRNVVISYCGQFCHDIVFDYLSDSLMAILNYDTQSKNMLDESFNGMFREAVRQFAQRNDLRLTLCISKEYQDINRLPEIKAEILDARWSRLHTGSGRIIENLSTSADLPNESRYLDQLREKIYKLFDNLDVDAARTEITGFFSLDKTLLGSREARIFIKNLIDHLFLVYAKAIPNTSPMELAAKKHEFIYLVNMTNTFRQMEHMFTLHTTQTLLEIINHINQTYAKPVSEAIQFINLHFCGALSLDLVANEIHVSPTYLSGLFHKETGQTFMDYVNSKKITYAKNELQKGKQNISEIAASLDYNDMRNFSKFFKKHVGITPSAYRAIYYTKATLPGPSPSEKEKPSGHIQRAYGRTDGNPRK